MTKKLMLLCYLTLGASTAFAGGLLTNTNQSAHFLRNPALDASTEIDAVYTNPAGLTFLSDGFHFSLTNQSVYQTRTITSTFAPFAGFNAGDPTKTFNGTASAPIVPSFQFAYKKDRYAISAAFAITGGGGKAVFGKGLPSFEAPISMIPLSLTSKGIPTSQYSVDSYMEGQQYIFGVQLNGSYKINDNLSAALGMRLNIVNNAYLGHLKNIMINPNQPAFGASYNGSLPVSAPKFFTDAATVLSGWSAGATSFVTGLQPIVSGGGGTVLLANGTAAGLNATQIAQIQGLLGAAGLTPAQIGAINIQTAQGTLAAAAPVFAGKAATMTTNAASTADKQLDCTQSGWGVTPIISLDYHLDGLNVAAKYEFKSALNIENKTIIDDTGLFPNGVNTPSDIPALLTIGAEYELCKSWKVSAGYHHFFDSDAKMANNRQQFINGGVNEYLAGTEYQINDLFLVSAGLQVTRTGVTDAYQTDMSYSLNSYSIGFGGAVKISPQLRLNLAYFFTNYDKWTKVSANYNGTGLPGTDVYDRTNKVFGIGLEYKF
ncbi:MAG: aromatic hydrocarbon degradation protein [Paludibacter sp.]|nr:aromatic hydrocarbon degradation protein [Paludibacter sp.]